MNQAISRDLPVPTRLSRGFVLSAVVGVAAVLTGAAVGGGWGAAFLVLVVVAWLTWTYPQVLPAILLVGPGFLHVLTYVSAGFAVRADVLASPLKFVPLLLALFGAADRESGVHGGRGVPSARRCARIAGSVAAERGRRARDCC